MGGAGGAPHPLVYQFYMKKIQKYIQKHTKNMQIHKNMCKHVEKHMKKCYVRVGNRTLADFMIGFCQQFLKGVLESVSIE